MPEGKPAGVSCIHLMMITDVEFVIRKDPKYVLILRQSLNFAETPGRKRYIYFIILVNKLNSHASSELP